MRIGNLLLILLMAFVAPACTTTTAKVEANESGDKLGAQWVKHAAEYQAVTKQVYALATRDLPRFVADNTWSAMPGYAGPSDLPPAVILDVDETVVSNVDFQLTFEPPFANHKLDDWSSHYDSLPINGVVEFVAAARAAGVTPFFVTNRPCETKHGIDDPCPQETTTIDDIRELGIDVDADHVMLSGERPAWNREKLSRREFIAKTHRVIMLLGDDLGDFVPCSRDKIVPPCKVSGTRESRAAALATYEKYWGAGWYIFPNPMHGSWTSTH